MIGFVTGLAAEARLPARHALMVAAGGGTPAGAAQAAEALVARGATSLASFGLAGGLDPALRPGTPIIPASVIAADETFSCDPAIIALFGGVTVPLILGDGGIAGTVEAKRALFESTGAAAIDLESAAVARVARRHGLEFAVLRAIADPAGQRLPPAALTSLDEKGRIVPARVLASLCRTPSQLPGLVSLGLNAARARRTLARALRDYTLRVSTTGT